MKIGIVGLGKIARRVYLPLYLDNFNFSDISVYSRNIDKLKESTKNYNFNLYDNLNLMLNEIDCLMVHSATVSHYDYIKLAIERRIPVYVDKPLCDSLSLSNELLALAKSNDTLVFVGYNRRYAPLYQKLKEINLSINRIHYEKHRKELTYSEDYKTAIIDDYIHLVDTVNHIIDEELILKDAVMTTSNNLELKTLYTDFTSSEKIISSFMARNSGSDLERVSIEAKNALITIENMREMKIVSNNITEIIKVDERKSDSQIRGFENALKTFFNLAKNNQYQNLSQSDAEEICDRIINKVR